MAALDIVAAHRAEAKRRLEQYRGDIQPVFGGKPELSIEHIKTLAALEAVHEALQNCESHVCGAQERGK